LLPHAVVIHGGYARKGGDLLRGDPVDGEGMGNAFIAEKQIAVFHAHLFCVGDVILAGVLAADNLGGERFEGTALVHGKSPFKKYEKPQTRRQCFKRGSKGRRGIAWLCPPAIQDIALISQEAQNFNLAFISPQLLLFPFLI
jgi:hypothetical protein